MPEDFTDYWYNGHVINYFYDHYWQETGDFESYLDDRDLFATYCCMSI
jgi:hypothetical protein